MACFFGRQNCLGPTFPCDVRCCSCSNCCENTVENPPVLTTNIAFFALTTPATVADDAIVPVSLISNVGTSIASPSVGTATLVAGTYEVSYNVTSTLVDGGTNSFGLSLGGSIIPASVSSAGGTAGELVSISNSVILTVSSTTNLTLNNLSDDEVTVSVANMTIRRIN